MVTWRVKVVGLTKQMRFTVSDQQRPRRVILQEALRPTQCGGRRLLEGEDQSETKWLLAQAQAARPSAAKSGTTDNGNPPRK